MEVRKFDRRSIGSPKLNGEIVARGKCTFCGHASSFEQIGSRFKNEDGEGFVALKCNNCVSILSYNYTSDRVFPIETEEPIEGLPESVGKYYEEGLRCLSVKSPNGALTLFRKVIHATAIYYDIAEKDEDASFVDLIKSLKEQGHIREKTAEKLHKIREVGADGAHVNENEPDMEQAKLVKEIIEEVLESVRADEKTKELDRIVNPKEESN